MQLFDDFTPAIATALILLTGNKAAPGLWRSLAAICGLIATLILYPATPQRCKSIGLLDSCNPTGLPNCVAVQS